MPVGGTPLYARPGQAYNAMAAKVAADRDQRGGAAHRRQERVPAGHRPGRPAPTLSSSEGSDTSVRVFSVAYGENADLDTLRKISEASRAAAYDATDPTSIERIFTAVISNF